MHLVNEGKAFADRDVYPTRFPTALLYLYFPPIRKDSDVIEAEILFTTIFVKVVVLIGIIIFY